MDLHGDNYWMYRALRLAVKGRHASPNPMVGCIILDQDGVFAGSGYHPEPGEPHAEVFALRQARGRSAGGTVFVTLEPCSHHGRTPPCADALIDAGIARVVIAMKDPDMRVAGAGIDKLRSAGVQTVVGVLETQSRSLNRAYIHHRITGMPWVTVKVAMSLDGKTATASGDSRWITGPITRLWVHRQLRDRSDAILVGVNTVILDDPALTTRLAVRKGRNPVRVVVDSCLRTPLDSSIVRQSALDGKTVIACLPQHFREKGQEYVNRQVTLLPIEPDNYNRVDLRQLLSTLGTAKGIATVLIEGGSSVVASAIKEGLVNRYVTTIAPKLIGGKSAFGPIGGDGIAGTMNEVVTIGHLNVRRSAADLVIDALLREI